MVLQEREIRILAYLFRYKYMNTHQIKRLFFQGQTDANMHRILTKLVQLNFITRIRFPKTPNTSLGSLLYLEPKGASCLATEWQLTSQELGFKRISKPLQSINHFYHRMRLVDFWIQLDLELEQDSIELRYLATETEKVLVGQQYISKTTIYTKDKTEKLIPDLCIILRNPNKNTEVVFFVEIDSGKETIAGRFQRSKVGSLLHKYQTYEKIMIDGNWKNNLETEAKAFLVLTVTETDQHINSIKLKCTKSLNFPQLFLCSTHDKTRKQGILFESVWQKLNSVSSQPLVKR